MIKKNENGQVLIIGIIMVLIMLLAVFVFFDIHNIIRAKIKVETAEQSAALAAARWQGESLNLIGELNLLIACETVLLDNNISTPGDLQNNKQKAEARILSINELQSRVSFLGPLLALNAAQQAAKNNGISTKANSYSATEDFLVYIKSVEDNPKYSPFYNVNNFIWRQPYIGTLKSIVDFGIVIRPNARIAGIENVTPSFLVDTNLYDAILGADQGLNTWCQINLRSLVKQNDNFFTGRWFSPSFDYINFPQQSEIYTLEVHKRNAQVSSEDYDRLLELTKKSDMDSLDNTVSVDPDKISRDICRFYVFNDSWFPTSSAYSGPDLSGNSVWRRGFFLRGDLKDNFVHGGAVAYAEAYQDVSSLVDFKAGKPKNDKFDTLVRKKNIITTRVGSNYGEHNNNKGGSVAKAFSNTYNPTLIPIVSPAFSEVALIPSTMNRIRVFSMSWPLVEKFIAWLQGVEDIYDTNLTPPVGTENMLKALQILGTPEFRKKGFNNDFLGIDSMDLLKLFDDDYKYPQSSKGAGWLQQACIRVDSNPPPEAKEGILYYYDKKKADELNANLDAKDITYIVPEAGDTYIYNGAKYLIRRTNGKLLTNETDPIRGCDAIYWGNGPGIDHGSNSGPAEL